MQGNAVIPHWTVYVGVWIIAMFLAAMMAASKKYPSIAKITRHWRFSNPTFVFAVVILVSGVAWLESLHVFKPADQAEHALTALGVLVGGSWTLYLFVLRKGFESALSIECTLRTEPCGKREFTVALEVTLANIGNRRITAPAALARDENRGWLNPFEYAGDLQIRKFEHDSETPGSQFVNWWHHDASSLHKVDGVPDHVSLLEGYRKQVGPSVFIDFIMEPGEKYAFTNVFVLPEGHYIAKIVFIGQRANEFWSRTLYFRVPCEEQQAAPVPVHTRVSAEQ